MKRLYAIIGTGDNGAVIESVFTDRKKRDKRLKMLQEKEPTSDGWSGWSPENILLNKYVVTAQKGSAN